MDCKEFSKYLIYCLPEYQTDLPTEARLHLGACVKCRTESEKLNSAFELRRQETQLSPEQEAESLARVWARVQERLKSGDLPEELSVDCNMVRLFLNQVADPLELTPRTLRWLDDHLDFCGDCRRELERLEQLRFVIIVAEMPVLAKEVIADAPPEFMEKVHKLRAVKSEDITCDQAEPYFRGMAICNLEAPAPAEIYRHVRNCCLCMDEVKQIHDQLGIAIPKVGSARFEQLRTLTQKESTAQMYARWKEHLQGGNLPQVTEVDCRMVRPVLARLVDPLNVVNASPSWIEKHLKDCEDCRKEFEGLKGRRDAVIVSEILACNPDATAKDGFPDAQPEVVKEIHRLRAVRPQDITCAQVSPYYNDMARCSSERPVPPEIYRHVRCCAFCEGKVKGLRCDLGIAIPEAGTLEFEELVAEHLRGA